MKTFNILLTALLILNSPALVWAQDSKTLEERLNALEQEVAILKRELELKKEEEAKVKTETPIISASAKDGFSIKSADDNFKLKIRGLIQADGRYFTDNKETLGYNDTFLVRRARPIFEGTVVRDFDFYLQPDFGSGTNQLIDAYLEYKYFPKAKFRAGKFKVPIGLERLQSDAVANFVELGLPSNLLPNRDVGVQLSGDLFKETVNYAVGYFNGVADNGSSDGDTNNEKDVAARVFAQPFKHFDSRLIQGLSVGVGGSYGFREGSTLPTYRSIGQASIFTYGTGVTTDGGHTRVSPQLSYFYNNLGILGEYVSSQQRIRNAANTLEESITNDAWQISGIYVLTGEDATYKGVKPLKPFDLKAGTWGAWALSGRYGTLDLDDEIFTSGFASASTRVSQADAWGAGLSWYLNNNLRVMLDYEHTDFEGGAAGGDRPSEGVVFSRFQLSY